MNANNFRLKTYANIAHNSPLIFIEKKAYLSIKRDISRIVYLHYI